MCYFSPRKQAWSSWNLVPQSCVMNASLSFILSSFSKWGQLCFCQHSWLWNKFQLLQACLRGKSGTFWKWHCLRIIALESKRLIHTLWTWCQITWKRIFYPIQEKSMVFNQECRWNNGSKSLHSFWATPYVNNYGRISDLCRRWGSRCGRRCGPYPQDGWRTWWLLCTGQSHWYAVAQERNHMVNINVKFKINDKTEDTQMPEVAL